MGLIVLDTGVLVGILDARDPFHGAARLRLGEAREAGDRFIVPAVAYAELLTGALLHEEEAARTVDVFLERLPAPVEPVDRRVAREAARLRARTLADRRRRQWRMPDALVAATAIVQGAGRILTTDAGWPELGEVEVEVLLRD
ncbi:MAG: type II toxin-antitoxin system VapC family toxin [Acidimicrobiia bacterium]